MKLNQADNKKKMNNNLMYTILGYIWCRLFLITKLSLLSNFSRLCVFILIFKGVTEYTNNLISGELLYCIFVVGFYYLVISVIIVFSKFISSIKVFFTKLSSAAVLFHKGKSVITIFILMLQIFFSILILYKIYKNNTDLLLLSKIYIYLGVYIILSISMVEFITYIKSNNSISLIDKNIKDLLTVFLFRLGVGIGKASNLDSEVDSGDDESKSSRVVILHKEFKKSTADSGYSEGSGGIVSANLSAHAVYERVQDEANSSRTAEETLTRLDITGGVDNSSPLASSVSSRSGSPDSTNPNPVTPSNKSTNNLLLDSPASPGDGFIKSPNDYVFGNSVENLVNSLLLLLISILILELVVMSLFISKVFLSFDYKFIWLDRIFSEA